MRILSIRIEFVIFALSPILQFFPNTDRLITHLSPNVVPSPIILSAPTFYYVIFYFLNKSKINFKIMRYL